MGARLSVRRPMAGPLSASTCVPRPIAGPVLPLAPAYSKRSLHVRSSRGRIFSLRCPWPWASAPY